MSQLQPVYTHDDFWVVYKPAGMSVQESHHGPGVLAELKARYEGEFLPVHRLDAGTSGLLLVARNAAANSTLSQMFQARAVEKFYLALSNQKPNKKQGTISGDMQKSRRGAWKLLHTHENPAATQFFSKGLGGMRLFLVKPLTGKTHQIRVALKSIGAPILGDEYYAGKEADRLYLHAYALRFCYQDQLMEFCALPPPENAFAALQDAEVQAWLRRPWDKAWPDAPAQIRRSGTAADQWQPEEAEE